ncbi:putative nuclease HARBI1 isoform X2 [Camellia sinensis]|uniref:putative nuclease HARBI1 isoform X2 n=1 Tax=Camellia sinensis TaxID=4442 RepID=UPI001036A58F|nr:putative nuclease HARBI1 isoform X2 [Camellia sinensis]
MSQPVFLLLCDALHSFGLTLPEREHGVSLEEKVAIFICALQGLSWKHLQERFQHSKETLSRNFHEDCIGALDGTHVMARVSQEYATSYYGRKGVPTQNIIAVCDFNLCFTFVSAGWDGSMHDSRVLHYVTTEEKHRFPHPAPGKYYLVDSGYSNKTGYLAPYKGYRYHQNAHRNRTPQNQFEMFNKAHSSLRSCIERTFGAWKSRWGALRNMQKLSFSNQVTFVCASMALHNFIRRHSELDEVMMGIPDRDDYMAPQMPDHDEYTRVTDVMEEEDSDPAMAAVRVNITNALVRQAHR